MEEWPFYGQAAAPPAVSAPPPPPDSEVGFSSCASVGPATVSAPSIAAARSFLTASAAAAASGSGGAPPPALAPSAVQLLGQPPLEGLDQFYVERLQRLYARMHPYQRELFRLSALQDFIVYLQTGGGKTWVAAALTCYRLAVHRGTRVFFVVRSVALADQQAAVLQRLVDAPVACIVGGSKQFKTPQHFLLATEHRVAVFIDTILFKWLGECPELVEEGLVSMLMLDEVHHAQAGPYKLICELLHARRAREIGDAWDAGLGQRGNAGANTHARLEGVGWRSPESVVLASELRSAVQVEENLRKAWELHGAGSAAASGASTAGAAATAAAGSMGTDGIGVRVASPVLEVMLQRAPRDVRLPHFGGLSASPVVHFTDTEQELVELLAITRCRLVSVVEETENLRQHLPQPALLALSFLPVFDDRVLQAQLRHVMLIVYRRMEALIKESSARSKLEVLRSASVLSPGFRELCNQFSVSTVMTVRFRSNLRIPRDSKLVAMVEAFQENQLLEAEQQQPPQHRGGVHSGASAMPARPTSAGSGTGSSATATTSSSSTWRRISDLKPEEEADVCVDFLQNALGLLQCLSDMLVALEGESRRAVIKKFVEVYSTEKLHRMRTCSLAITAVVLRPILKSLYELMHALERNMRAHRMQWGGGRGAVDNGDGGGEELEAGIATAAHASLPVAPSSGPPALPPPSSTAAGLHLNAVNCVPPAVRHLSTRTQVLLRLFAELALVAVTMADRDAKARSGGGGGGGGGDGQLRVLAFVSTRDQATYLMELLRRRSPWIWQVLQPSVLLGQGAGKKNALNYMTRAQQVEVLDRLRAGHTRLVFSTSVAEEGIDVPACHVVVRCNAQTELRTIVQCCGRLRMRRTLFVSLSNLLYGHPRLGYVVGAVKQCERMLLELGQRSRGDAWNLAGDDLVDGTERGAAGMPGESLYGGAAVSLPPNPNEVNRLTFFEQNLVSRRQHILAALQRAYQAEVYCVQRRDIKGSPLEVMEFTLLMGIPVPAAAAAARTGVNALPPLHGSAYGGLYGGAAVGTAWRSMGVRTRAARDEAWVRVCGRFTGGVVGAHHKSFVEFLRSAKDHGMVTGEGRLVEPPPFLARPLEDYPALQVTDGDLGSGQHAWATSFPTYAATLTPNVVFLGPALCLCRASTWPPSVLQHFFSERATVLNTYEHDLWTSRLEPQQLLYDELREAGAPAAKYTSEAAERRSSGYAGDAGEADDADDDSTSAQVSRTCSRTRGSGAVGFAVAVESTGGSSSRESRNWVRQPITPGTAMTTVLAIAEVRFRVPVHRVEGAAVSGMFSDGIGTMLAPLQQPQPRQVSGSIVIDEYTRSSVEMCDVATGRRANDGREVQTVQREFVIRYRGKYAEQVVSMVALRILGVRVVHGVDFDELERTLLQRRRVSSLQGTA